jgi:hypothetical protein
MLKSKALFESNTHKLILLLIKILIYLIFILSNLKKVTLIIF